MCFHNKHYYDYMNFYIIYTHILAVLMFIWPDWPPILISLVPPLSPKIETLCFLSLHLVLEPKLTSQSIAVVGSGHPKRSMLKQ
jgi:hypothetical protein